MPYELLDDNQGRYEILDPVTTKVKGEGAWKEVERGLATAPINAYLGIKQLFGGLDPIEQKVLAQNKAAEKNAPFSSFVSNVATLVPSMFIPGANTVAGAGVVGAATGLAQPVEGEQTFGNIASGKGMNTVLGGALGAGGQYLGNKIGGWFSGNLAQQEAEAAKKNALNSVKTNSFNIGSDAGYVVPPSEINPSFMTNRLESVGGKAAIRQEATLRNQDVTNALARKALGLPDDAPLSREAVLKVREANYAPYKQVSNLPPTSGSSIFNTQEFNPKAALEQLKQSRNDAQGWFNAYNRSANPEDLAKAKAAKAIADNLETSLENYASSKGQSTLVDELIKARKEIAKTYTVDRALNPATGDVSARVLGSLYSKNKPLSDGLDVIGQFNAAFPMFTGDAVRTQAPGVSRLGPFVGGLLSTGGAAASGSPAGLLAGGLPLLSHPARALALSPALQKAPEYAAGALAKFGGKALTPELAAAYLRSIGVTVTPQLTEAILAAQ